MGSDSDFSSRSHPRVRAHKSSVHARRRRLLFSGPEVAAGDVILDISRGGFAFLGDPKLQVENGEILEVTLEHPGMEPIRARGEVRWVRNETPAEAELRGALPERTRRMVGVTFVTPDEKTSTAIGRLIEAELGNRIHADGRPHGFVAEAPPSDGSRRFRVHGADHDLVGRINRDENRWRGMRIREDALEDFHHEQFLEVVRWLLPTDAATLELDPPIDLT